MQYAIVVRDGAGYPQSCPKPRNVADKEDPDLLSFCRTPRTRREIADYLGVKTVFYVTSKYINPLVEEGKLKMTIPDKPKSKNQKYFSASHE